MLHVVLGEALQDRIGSRGSNPQDGRKLDKLVVLLFDDLPVDRAGQDRLLVGVFFRRGKSSTPNRPLKAKPT